MQNLAIAETQSNSMWNARYSDAPHLSAHRFRPDSAPRISPSVSGDHYAEQTACMTLPYRSGLVYKCNTPVTLSGKGVTVVTTAQVSEEWLNASAVAERLGISRVRASVLINRGDIPGVKTRIGMLVDPRDLERVALERKRNPPRPGPRPRRREQEIQRPTQPELWGVDK